MAECKNKEGQTPEEAAIKQLRAKIFDVIAADKKFDDDFYLLQWLKAQKLKPDKAEEMIRKSIKWREEKNIHTNLEAEFPPEHLQEFKALFSKSKDGVPIVHFHVGAMDIKKGIAAYGKARWTHLWSMVFAQIEEKMIEYNKAKNTNTQQITSECTSGIIGFADIKGFSSLQLLNLDVIRCCVENTSNLMNYFPGIFGIAFMFNMNSVFKVCLNAMKPLIAGSPNFTLEVYGTDEKVWREKLLKIIESEDLEEFESYWRLHGCTG